MSFPSSLTFVFSVLQTGSTSSTSSRGGDSSGRLRSSYSSLVSPLPLPPGVQCIDDPERTDYHHWAEFIQYAK